MRRVLVLLVLLVICLPSLAETLGIHYYPGTHLMPLRYLCDWLGASIQYDAKTQTATVKLDKTALVLQVGNDTATLNGKPLPLPLPLYYPDSQHPSHPVSIEDGVMYVPVRAVCEALGGTVDHNYASPHFVIHPKLPGEQLEITLEGDIGSPLHMDACCGLLRMAKLHVARGADVNAPGAGGCTPLLYALLSGHTEITRYLLSVGAKVNIADNAGDLPVDVAARWGDVSLVKTLIAAGANIEGRDEKGLTPFLNAIVWQCDDVLTYLVKDAKVNVQAVNNEGRNALILEVTEVMPEYDCHCKSIYSRPERIRMLVADGLTVDAHNKDGGWTALQCAISEGLPPDVVQTLLELGADPNVKRADGSTLLHLAAESAGAVNTQEQYVTEIVRRLLSAHADVNARDHDGATPLLLAAEVGANYLVKILVEAHASLDMGDAHGNTPLHVLAGQSEARGIESLKLLLAAGAKVDVTNQDGDTPLHCAARARDGDMYEKHDWTIADAAIALIKAGAMVDARNKTGETPLSCAAASGGVVPTMKALLAAGADVNTTDDKGQTPLHRAAGNDYGDESVATLLAAHAKVDAVDNLGMTPLHYAAAANDAQAIRTLLAAGASYNARDKQGNTPMHALLAGDATDETKGQLDYSGLSDTLKAFVLKGAPVETVSGHHSVLSYAVGAKDVDFVRQLLALKVDVNAVDPDGVTPLLEAIVRYSRTDKSLEVVRLLLDYGASPTSPVVPLKKNSATFFRA